MEGGLQPRLAPQHSGPSDPVCVPASPEPLPQRWSLNPPLSSPGDGLKPLRPTGWPQKPRGVPPTSPAPPPPMICDPWFPAPRGDPARRRHLSVPAVTLAHRPQIHVGPTAAQVAAQVTKVAGPLGQSPEPHVDARDGAVGHVTRRRPAPGSGGFGTSSSVSSPPPGRKVCPSPSPDTLSPRSQWEPRVGGGRQALGLPLAGVSRSAANDSENRGSQRPMGGAAGGGSRETRKFCHRG